jgi:hypothetical protein
MLDSRGLKEVMYAIYYKLYFLLQIVEEEKEVYDDDYDGGEKTEEELLGSIVFDL